MPIARLYSVSVDGGLAEALPMPEAGSGDYSPDSSRMVYSPQFRDFRSEKRYGGGQANVLYIFDLKTSETKRISEGPRPARDAMWIGDSIYFNSDRDGHFNLYSYGVFQIPPRPHVGLPGARFELDKESGRYRERLEKVTSGSP